MYLCQWSFDIVFGKQSEVMKIIREWGAEKMKSSAFSRSTGCRVYCGYAGRSASHIVDEYVFESLGDFEEALAGMSQPQFKKICGTNFRVYSTGDSEVGDFQDIIIE